MVIDQLTLLSILSGLYLIGLLSLTGAIMFSGIVWRRSNKELRDVWINSNKELTSALNKVGENLKDVTPEISSLKNVLGEHRNDFNDMKNQIVKNRDAISNLTEFNKRVFWWLP